MAERIASEKTRVKEAAKSNALLHLAKKRARTRTRNAVHARRTSKSANGQRKYRNNVPLPVTNATLVDQVETSLARIKPERKNVKRTRKNVRETRRCKRIVPRRAKSASNKRLPPSNSEQHSYEARSCRCPNYKIIGDDKFSNLSYLTMNLYMLS